MYVEVEGGWGEGEWEFPIAAQSWRQALGQLSAVTRWTWTDPNALNCGPANSDSREI